MSKIDLRQGDCLEKMRNIPDGSIDMVVTSPPYDNLRSYNGNLNWGDHVWKPVITELYRVLADGGVAVWVVGDATIIGVKKCTLDSRIRKYGYEIAMSHFSPQDSGMPASKSSASLRIIRA